MTVWLLDFVRWPGWEADAEIVGVYTTRDLAVQAAPYVMQWTGGGETLHATDPNGDGWFVFPLVLDAPIEATYPTWENAE